MKTLIETILFGPMTSTAWLVNACTLFTLLTAGSLAAQSGVSFVAHRDYVAADAGRLFAQDDLNGDGIADLVVPNATPNFALVSVLLGKADGSFQPPVFFDTGSNGASAAVIADFNGDGKKDVAVTTLAAVSVLLGDGNGNLGTPRAFGAGFIPESLSSGDFNGDGKTDLAVANFGSNDVSILLGNGRGNFRLATTLTVGHAPLGITAGDFNQDGHTDLAVANSDQGGGNPGPAGNTVSILLGTGQGTFNPAVNIPVARGPIGVAVSHLNHDNKRDVVVTNSITDQVSVLLGNGDGSFQTPTAFTVASGGRPPQGFTPSYVAAEDLNQDGNIDVVVANRNTSSVAVLLGDGTGKLGVPANLSVGRSPVAVLTGDFNHDGKRDFVTSNTDANTVSVMFGKGNGAFRSEPNFPVEAGPVQAIASDFNSDGFPDVATVNSGNSSDGHTVSVLLGKAGGRFAPQKISSVGTDPLALASGDLNNDGHMDLVAANFGKYPNDPGNFSLLLGIGDGTFLPAENFAAGDFPDTIAVADFNGDGKQDVAVGDFGTNVGVGGISILLGDGQGGFGTPVNVTAPLDNVFQVLTGDFNRDGRIDLAFSSRATNDTVSIMLGKGDGTFRAAKIATTPFFVFVFALGDFNHDGIPDLAVEEGGVIEMLMGDGSGNFQSLGVFSEGEAAVFSAVQSLAVDDFNGDGFLDIAAPDVFSDNVSILLGNGDGTLGAGQLFAGGPGGRTVAGDFNHDQRPDLAIAATDLRNIKGKVMVLVNNTPADGSAVSLE